MLYIIPITKSGTTSFSFAVVRTDVEEAVTRKNAAGQGLLAGARVSVEHRSGDFDFWKLRNLLKQHWES